ncbi:hypothetical protein LOTGIDRAFT_160290 [Lottia gigantea]|uniref:Homeobox domain-containing protein n=1 Tax=Lottia gigantea TaxID=225164 RepID=V4ALV7_LOTGI|nr:hypothetical protein LOTGIDRAFT_160290 [Lottia gigantea]ESO95745.1 hypothetical protein LOTGIDRAFT_160290 [Lottia gigantea]
MKQVTKTSPEQKPKKRGGIQPRNRTKYTAAQLNALESLFMVSQYPDSLCLEDLCKSLGVTVERIQIWFQNRRSKFKRQSKDGHMAWMRKQIFNQGSPRPNPMDMIHSPASHATSSTTCQSISQPTCQSISQPTCQPTCQSTSPDRSCHVLSPPVENASPSNSPPVKPHPRSNLHYMPETLYYPGTTASTYNSNNNTTSSQPSYSTQNHLLMSHLLNDVTTTTSYQQQQQPCNYSNYQNNNYNNLYNNYPYYSQMSSYYSLNNSSPNLYSSSSSSSLPQQQSLGV